MKILTLILVSAIAAVLPAWAGDAPKSATCEEGCGAGECSSLISAYEKVGTALAADNLAEAQAAAADFACCLNCEGQSDLAGKVEALAKTASIADARTRFKDISAAVIPLVEKGGDHFVMTCPMAGADWIQTSATVANPYYGSQMLRCGAIKKTVKSGS